MNLHILIISLKWKFGFRGKKCKCGFHELAHINPDLEFDIDEYPCKKYRPISN
jgi:hypothetical protein